MQKIVAAPAVNGIKRDWLYCVHKWSGLISIPFLLVSLGLAVGLTHANLLQRFSNFIYPSLPIAQVDLGEPIQPGSWNQAMKLARLATGNDAHVIAMRSGNIAWVAGFEEFSPGSNVAKRNPYLRLIIDTDVMKIVRVEGQSNSLYTQAHAIHAIRFFGVRGFTISAISVVALLTLLITGGMIALRDRSHKQEHKTYSLWHVRVGQSIGVFIVIVSLTALDFEFPVFGVTDNAVTHPVLSLRLSEPISAGSLDQARQVVKLTAGYMPQAAYIKESSDVKFSKDGDGNGGAVWMDINTMTVKRITDWRNDKQELRNILHDGRWFGGMNTLNINDVVALILLFLVLSGAAITWRNRHV